jgi:hypothetical protein
MGLVVGPVLGLVPGPPGPNTGEKVELEEEGELAEDGEFEEEAWAELSSSPPHPVIFTEAHKIQREASTLDNHLAITALDQINGPT